jgi:hypothetical protein
LENLFIGIVLFVASIAVVLACRPRRGKTVWFVGKPLLAPLVSIVVVAGLAYGVFMVAAHFSDINEGTIGGKKRRSDAQPAAFQVYAVADAPRTRSNNAAAAEASIASPRQATI